MTDPIFIIVDLFCGAGGTTTGFVQAQLDGNNIAKVIACVNHDPKAIKSHWANHPDVVHFEEDIRTLDLKGLINEVEVNRRRYPDSHLILWASLECTNFSKAKGGQPRDADSRTLADHLLRYINAIDPDYIQIENVVEFMSWGPLDEKGKPVSRKNGQDWMRWRKEICGIGYYDQWRELNSANYGAYTSRNRLFGVFAKPDLPISFPVPTHTKNPTKNSIHGDLHKWKAVKDVLDFEDEGESIFSRKKPLSDKTLERIYAGLLKYVANGDKAFLSKYFSGKPKGKVNSVDVPGPTVTTFGGTSLVQVSNISVDGPSGSLTTIDHHALVQPKFLLKYNSTNKETGKHTPPSVEEPAPVVSTQGRLGLVQAQFLTHYYSNGGQHSSVENPAPTIPTKARSGIVSPEFLTIYNGKSLFRSVDEPSPVIPTNDRLALVQPQYFIDKHYGKSSQNQSIENPAGTIMPNDKHRLVQCTPFIMPTNYDNKPKSIEDPLPSITADRHWTYIVNPSHGGHATSTEAPCPVIVARQDKAPLYVVSTHLLRTEHAEDFYIVVFEGDSEAMIRIKEFMAAYGIVDIKMRMLRVLELLSIQGFPKGYKLEGNQADQKKFIGNSVVPQVVKAWTEAMALRIIDHQKNEMVA